MRKPLVRKWDLCAVLTETAVSRDYLERASRAAADSQRVERLAARECAACYYLRGRQGAAMSSETECAAGCGRRIVSGNSCLDRLCPECADVLSLCVYCGGDRETKMHRKVPFDKIVRVVPEETEPCCECGAEYPRRDLMEDGEVFCPKCRKMNGLP